MGVEYYLANTREKTFYELGKGYWPSGREQYLDPKELMGLVQDKLGYWGDDDSTYHLEIYAEIRNFLFNAETEDILVLNDADDSCRLLEDKNGRWYYEQGYQGEYKQIGSRYRV